MKGNPITTTTTTMTNEHNGCLVLLITHIFILSKSRNILYIWLNKLIFFSGFSKLRLKDQIPENIFSLLRIEMEQEQIIYKIDARNNQIIHYYSRSISSGTFHSFVSVAISHNEESTMTIASHRVASNHHYLHITQLHVYVRCPWSMAHSSIMQYILTFWQIGKYTVQSMIWISVWL